MIGYPTSICKLAVEQMSGTHLLYTTNGVEYSLTILSLCLLKYLILDFVNVNYPLAPEDAKPQASRAKTLKRLSTSQGNTCITTGFSIHDVVGYDYRLVINIS